MPKLNGSDIKKALSRLGMIRFWPSDESTRAQIGIELARMCPHAEALDWLVTQMLTRVGEWRGIMDLRGILCWRFRPADGIETNSISTGFTPADGETQSAIVDHERRQLERSAEEQAKALLDTGVYVAEPEPEYSRGKVTKAEHAAKVAELEQQLKARAAKRKKG